MDNLEQMSVKKIRCVSALSLKFVQQNAHTYFTYVSVLEVAIRV
jgi:hypothetical protein